MLESSVSRRDRPAKPALSRRWVVQEATAIARSEGLDRLTMRRLARALDTGPASLYVYVANTAELHSAVLDELITDLLEPDGDSWDERLERLLAAYSDLLSTYPGLARSALLSRPTGPNAVGLYDRVMGLLLDGGTSPDRAAWGVDLLLLHVTASAAEHSAPSPGDTDAASDPQAEMDNLSRALHQADPARAPHVAAFADQLLSGNPGQRRAWALKALMTGIAGTPLPPTNDR